jgi:hypothetical protein
MKSLIHMKIPGEQGSILVTVLILQEPRGRAGHTGEDFGRDLRAVTWGETGLQPGLLVTRLSWQKGAL